MNLMPVGPSVEYKSTDCCATALGLAAGSAISGALSSKLDSPALDRWGPSKRPSFFEPNIFDILGICLGARDDLVRI
jgi:hypothetical protein